MTFHDPRMSGGARWIGLMLVGGAVVLLLDAPKKFSPWHFLWFLVFLVVGALLAMGQLLLPSQAPAVFRPRMTVPPRVRRVAFVLATVLAVAQLLFGLYLAVAGRRILPVDLVDLVPIAGVPLLSGAGLLIYLWRRRPKA